MNYRSIAIQLAIVLGIPVGILAAYWFMFRVPEPEDPQAAEKAVLVKNGAKVREALATIGRLRFDDSLFSMPAFASLEDQTVPIQEEELGRENPFVPADGFLHPVASSTPAIPPSQRPR